MKSIYIISFSFTLLAFSLSAMGQDLSGQATHSSDPSQQYTGIGGSVGASIFKGKPYFLIGFAPQFEFGPWGIGIDGNIRISDHGTLRKEDFDQLYDYIRFINYVRFGKPYDDVYARFGGITNASLGHGAIVDNYSNNSSYDNRRIGLWSKLDLGFVGGELILSDVFAKSLVAARALTRPFHLVPGLASTWFFRNIEFGGTASYDFDSNATRIIPNREPYVKHFRDTIDGEPRDSLVIDHDLKRLSSPLTIYGLDAALTVWQGDGVEGRIYGDYVNIINFNEGFLFGARASFYTDSQIFFDARLERFLFKNHFLPNYYNSFYERERYNDDVTSLDYITKATRLADTAASQGNGSKFGIFFREGRVVEASLTYSHLDNRGASDLMEIRLTFPDLWWKFFGSLSYQRRNIDGPKDYFKFDENTLAGARLSFQPFPFITLSAIARWTFTRDENNHVQTQGIIEPKATFVARF